MTVKDFAPVQPFTLTAEQLQDMTKAELVDYFVIELVPTLGKCWIAGQPVFYPAVYKSHAKPKMIETILKLQKIILKYQPAPAEVPAAPEIVEAIAPVSEPALEKETIECFTIEPHHSAEGWYVVEHESGYWITSVHGKFAAIAMVNELLALVPAASLKFAPIDVARGNYPAESIMAIAKKYNPELCAPIALLIPNDPASMTAADIALARSEVARLHRAMWSLELGSPAWEATKARLFAYSGALQKYYDLEAGKTVNTSTLSDYFTSEEAAQRGGKREISRLQRRGVQVRAWRVVKAVEQFITSGGVVLTTPSTSSQTYYRVELDEVIPVSDLLPAED